MTADEICGSLYLLVCLAQFPDGWKLLEDAMLSKGSDTNLQDVLEAVEALCCFDAWTHLDKFWKIDQEEVFSSKAQDSICHCLHLIKTHLPCVEGCGWKLVTFHNITHMVSDMKKFGKPKEVNTKVGEKNHKYFAKSIGCQS